MLLKGLNHDALVWALCLFVRGVVPPRRNNAGLRVAMICVVASRGRKPQKQPQLDDDQHQRQHPADPQPPIQKSLTYSVMAKEALPVSIGK